MLFSLDHSFYRRIVCADVDGHMTSDDDLDEYVQLKGIHCILSVHFGGVRLSVSKPVCSVTSLDVEIALMVVQ